MENRKIKNLTKEDNGCLSTEIEIGSDLRMNQEYSNQSLRNLYLPHRNHWNKRSDPLLQPIDF